MDYVAHLPHRFVPARSALLRQVTGEGAGFTVLGLVIGLGVAIAGSRVLTAFLHHGGRHGWIRQGS